MGEAVGEMKGNEEVRVVELGDGNAKKKGIEIGGN